MRPQLALHDFGVDTVYHTFKENCAKGYPIESIRNILEEHAIPADEISSGLERLLFTVVAFMKSQRQEGVPIQKTEQYLLQHGYSKEIIHLAFLRAYHTQH
jgi:hypothetical protein